MNFSRRLFVVSLMERLGLIELLSVLGSLLIGVEILLGSPRGRIPQSGVHSVPRAIVK